MISSDNKAIRIPASHYVGFAKRADDEIALGFMTPDGTDQAALKRKKTVDDWAQYTSANPLPPQTFDNKPLSGFRMGRTVRHGYGWGQGNVKWRIEDPRGFELEISSPNFAQIVSCTTIENGEILDQCVWGRLGADNVLIPVSSEVYKAATTNTERMSKKVSLRDVKPGDHVVMQNGNTGRFLGQFYVILMCTYRHLKFEVVPNKRFIMQTDEDKFEAIATPKLSGVTPGEPISAADAERLINDTARRPHGISAGGGHFHSPAVAVAADPKVTFTYSLKPFATLADAMLQAQSNILGHRGEDWGFFIKSNWHTKSDHLHLIEHSALVQRQEIIYQRAGHWDRGDGLRSPINPGDQIDWYVPEGAFETSHGYRWTSLFSR